MWPRSDDEYDHRIRLNGHTVELLDEAWHSQVKPKPCRYGSLFDTVCFQVVGRGFVSRSCGKGDSTARAASKASFWRPYIGRRSLGPRDTPILRNPRKVFRSFESSQSMAYAWIEPHVSA